MKRIGIIAALPGELKPLARDWQRRGPLWLGHIADPAADIECVACCSGMGAAAATRAFSAVSQDNNLDAVVSYGWAGALSCGVKPGHAYNVAEVIDSRTGERYPAAKEGPGNLRLVTLDHVARADEKRPLGQRYQAVMVDMEAATVARLARIRDLPFYCMKGISDGATDSIPDFNRFLASNGQMRMAAFVGYATLHPMYWRPLLRLGQNSSKAAVALARLLRENLSHGNQHSFR